MRAIRYEASTTAGVPLARVLFSTLRQQGGAIGLAILLAGCTSPAKVFATRAATIGLRADVVAGTRFHHVVYRSPQSDSQELHVYLDGDGTPSLAGVPAPDPTPRDLLVLRLLTLDTRPVVYLGRPCYHGLAAAPHCTAEWWTRARYSPAVVDSMEAALRTILASAAPVEKIVWFGYSGGGTLAVLLAPRFRETVAVITVAANLDTAAWATYHGGISLKGSLNPAEQPVIRSTIAQRHYVGSRDRIVPPAVVARGPVSADSVIVVEGFDHRCCWADLWPSILDYVDRMTLAESPDSKHSGP